MHVDLIGTYSRSRRQQHTGIDIIKNNASRTCMTTIDPATGWFQIFKVPTFDLDQVMGVNDDYIDK